MQNRVQYIDQVGGLMTFIVIFVHVVYLVDPKMSSIVIFWNYVEQILFFYMPWFFFKAGMFFRIAENYHLFVKKLFLRLFVPFLVFAIIGEIIKNIEFIFVYGAKLRLNMLYAPFISLYYNGNVWGNGALWFLFTLILIRLFVYTITRMNNSSLLLFLIASICALCGFILHLFNLELPLYCANFCTGSFFYILGYLLRGFHIRKVYFCMVLMFFVIMILIIPSNVCMYDNQLKKGFYLLWYLYSIVGCVAINELFALLQLKNILLERLGKKSMTYYVSHMVYLSLFETIFSVFGFHGEHKQVLVLLLLIILLPLTDYLFSLSKMSWMVGEKINHNL